MIVLSFRTDIGKEENMLAKLLCENRKSRAIESFACCSASIFGIGVQIALLNVGDVASMKTVVVEVASSVIVEVMFMYATAVVVVATLSVEVIITLSKTVVVMGCVAALLQPELISFSG